MMSATARFHSNQTGWCVGKLAERIPYLSMERHFFREVSTLSRVSHHDAGIRLVIKGGHGANVHYEAETSTLVM